MTWGHFHSGEPLPRYPEQGYTQLHAWYADHLLGPWTPHACNPLKTDVRSSRPAGPPFSHNGRLFRPAQDCTGRYGSAIVINEVLHLSPTRFEERTVTRLTPSRHWRYRAGMHTLCPVNGDPLASLEALAAELGALNEKPADVAQAGRPEKPSGKFTLEGLGQALGATMPEGAIVVDESVTTGRGFFPYSAGAPPLESPRRDFPSR